MPPTAGALRRELGLFDATMINAGTIIASAIFLIPSALAAELGSSLPILLVWVAGGAVSLCGALCVAELGAAMPEAGGQYVYLSRAFHPIVGFLYGWSAFLVINTASIAAVAVGFATYVGFFMPLSPTGVKLVAIGSVLFLTVLNARGLRLGAWTQNILTSLKIVALLMIIVLAATLAGGTGAHLDPLWPAGGLRTLGPALGPALVAVLWAYDGWIEVTYVGGEVKQPGRNLPRSIVLSTLLVTALYVLVNAAYLYLLSPGRIATSPLVASDAMQVVLGTGGAAFIAIAILISTLGANNGMVFTSARIPYAMAEEGLFFAWARRLHPRYNTPIAILVLQLGACVALTLTGSYVQLATYVVFVSFLFYSLSAAAVIVLRVRQPGLDRPYRAWGYPWTPLLFILFAIYLVLDTVVHAPRDSLVGAAIVLLGLPAYWYWRRNRYGDAPAPTGSSP